ncbi:MAG: NAD-dependent DNA ligase LigA [Verrucomicrobia bacterium]|nr:NAD-dependent DNA ligase LigA [Verrucomicrobiota bacterium]
MPRSSLLKGLVGALVGGIWFVTATPSSSADSSSVFSPAPITAPTSPDAARQRIAALRAEIAHHDALYFQKAAPEITDAAYDALKRELRALETTYPAEAAAIAQPVPIVDDHNDGFAKVAHRTPMLSLDKAYTEAELRAFCVKTTTKLGQTTNFVVEPKIDGLSVSAIYEHGKFVRASTRGNGREGDDITANARMIRSLPHELRASNPDGTHNVIPDIIELRGEIFLSRAEFTRLNRERFAEGEPQLAHPRNVAAGTIKSRDSNETAERHLDIVFYSWGTCEPTSSSPTTQQAFHAQAKAWGLPVLETFQVVPSADEAWAAVQALGQKRAKLVAPIDGAVLKLDDVVARTKFGESDHAPNWAIAYKYAPERAVTQLRGFTIQVGRTGLLTPVAELAPVALAGSTIARASLHNREQIARLDLRLGDFVFVERAGEIIPEIVGVDVTRRPLQTEPFAFPTLCPACNSPVIAAEDVAAVLCANSTGCPAQLRERLAHFAGKSCVDIKGLGVATIAELIASGHVRTPAELYALKLETLATLSGFRKKSSAQLLAEIDRSRRADLWRFINGLSIPRVGPATAKLLAKRFASMEKLAAAQPADFSADLGKATTQAILAYLAVPNNRALMLALAKVIPRAELPSTATRLKGETFVLTGRLPTLSREEVVRLIEAAGGVVASNVTKTTDYVIAGTDAGEKLTKAQKLNIPILDEMKLLQLLKSD